MSRINVSNFFATSSVALLAAVAWIQCGGDDSSVSRDSGTTVTPPTGDDSGSTTPTTDSSTTPTTDSTAPPPGDVSTTPAGCTVLTSANATIYNGITTAPTCGTSIPTPNNGYWFHYNEPIDGGNPVTLVGATPGPDTATQCAIHVTGAGFTVYAGAGFNLLGGNAATQCFDASAFSGISLQAKGTVSGTRMGQNPNFVPGPQTFRIKLLAGPTYPTGWPEGDDYGGYCTVNTDGVTWTTCTLKFADAQRLNFNAPPDAGPDKLDVTQMEKVQFEFDGYSGADAATTSMTFDVWLDDIVFTP